jgi:hypothetical protein
MDDPPHLQLQCIERDAHRCDHDCGGTHAGTIGESNDDVIVNE